MSEKDRAQNKKIARNLLDAWNERGESHLPRSLVHPNVTTHFGSGPHGGTKRDNKAQVVVPRAAFRDQLFTEEILIANDEYVFVAWEISGIHAGSLYGRRPSRKYGDRITAAGADLMRIKNGRIIEHWDYYSKARVHLLARMGLFNRSMQQRLIKNDLLGRNRTTGKISSADVKHLKRWLDVV